MGYVGNQQTQGFSQIPAKQDLTGATGTSLTLSHAVASAEGIDLFINHVRQEPTESYTTEGTTVNLVGYSVAATDDIYVVYNSLALQTSVPPDSSVSTAKIIDGNVTSAKLDTNIAITGDLTVDTSALKVDSTNNRVGIGTASPNNGKLEVTHSSSTVPAGYFRNTSASGDSPSLTVQGGANNAAPNFSVLDYNGNTDFMVQGSGDIFAVGIYNNSTSGGGNVRVQSNGLLQRDTSSRRYKNTINDATHGLTELLELRPVTYKSNTDGDTVFGGLIAEEVHNAGLTEFVSYNDDKEPDALAYGNMVSLCIKAIQEQQTTITALEARITALEAS